MGTDYRWVVDEVTDGYRWVSYPGRQVGDEVTDGYRWVSYAGRRNRHVVAVLSELLYFFQFGISEISFNVSNWLEESL